MVNIFKHFHQKRLFCETMMKNIFYGRKTNRLNLKNNSFKYKVNMMNECDINKY